MPAKQKNKALASALKFIASLIFLYVVFVSPPVALALAGAVLWAPLLYAVAVIGSISLFLGSLMSFAVSSEMLNKAGWKMNKMVSLAIVAWAAIAGGLSLSLPMELAIVAFVIGWFGSGMAEM
jgi:hypothetical protein